MHVGILTGGGDVPGLNVAIKAAVERASEKGWKMTGIRRGWAGLVDTDPGSGDPHEDGTLLALDRERVRTVDRTGGTFLHSSRTNPSKVKPAALPPHLRKLADDDPEAPHLDVTPHVREVISALGLDALICIGGDDTLSYGARLADEGVPTIAIPKTMDNDVYGTDYCIGFSTAVSRSVDAIDNLRTTAGSHERAAVIELFGRYCGETSLISAHLAGADRAVISEVPYRIDALAELVRADLEANPSNYSMICISEGAAPEGGELLEHGPEDPYGHRRIGGIGEYLAAQLKDRGIETLAQRLGYLMRSGTPDALDRMVARSFGQMAIDELAAGRSGLMVAVREGRYTTVPASAPVEGEKRVDVGRMYDAAAYRPRIVEVSGLPMFLY